ncbi:hypothetical protein CD351_02565 [Erythrobacter sp. KY5]|uniref:hypothetical protein n=1 Tax=Erythrobacter sp. KY5 TaxID=2011159 RepID=UPI000DBF0287|nr:hypothetical protein [Erythrobacter sp. KY5]AWW73306.1 hypothetical protein CD351_02565 [Erythrobacter sp. KY5]
MARSPQSLSSRISQQLDAEVRAEVREFARALAEQASEGGALAVLFYGSNLRTGSLDGVLDFYVLHPGETTARIWPRISYHERDAGGITLRAKVATMGIETFAKAASGELTDTTIWARFVQPSALAWVRSDAARAQVTEAIAAAAITAARLAAALGPQNGTADDYWRALFRATYKAEFRVEKPGRENDILSVNEAHFEGLLPLAFEAAGVQFSRSGDRLTPSLAASERSRILSWWQRRQRLGKPLNFARLAKASTTFEGAARYAAWKIERHTGLAIEVTPFRERYPLLAAPGVLWALRKHRKRRE